MKAVFLILVMTLSSQVFSSSERVFTKTAEIVDRSDVPAGTMVTSTVIMENDYISAEIVSENGFACYFEGRKDLDVYIPINYLSETGKGCTLDVSMSGNKMNVRLDEGIVGACGGFCSPRAERSITGLTEQK